MLDYVKLLTYLVSINTINHPEKNIHPDKSCAKFIYDQLKSLKWKVEMFESAGVYSVLGVLGKGDPVTMFLSHYDTVPIGSGWDTDPFQLTIKGEKGYGRGSIDDKGNIVALLMTAEALSKYHDKLKGRVLIGVTGDEEIGGRNGAGTIRTFIDQKGWQLKHLIIADGIGEHLDYDIVYRRRNQIYITLTVPKKKSTITGISETREFTTEYLDRDTRHSAHFAPGVDKHALIMASHFMRRYPKQIAINIKGAFTRATMVPNWVRLEYAHPDPEGSQLEYDKGLTDLIRCLYPLTRVQFPVGYSDYGINFNPNRLWTDENNWYVMFDMRAMTKNEDDIRKALTTALDDLLKNYTLEIEVGRAYYSTPRDAKLIRITLEAANNLNLNPNLTELGGITDARFFADLPIEIFDFGPKGSNVHGPNEFVILESILKASEFYTAVILKIHT